MMGFISWGVKHYNLPCESVSEWFNNGPVTFKTVVVGMGANTVFGFIDNAGLFFGGCYLDDVF